MKLPGIAVATLAITALAGGTALAQATMQPIPNPPEKAPAMGHHGHHHHMKGHHHHMKGHHHHMKGHHHHMKAAAKEDEAAPAPAPATPQ